MLNTGVSFLCVKFDASEMEPQLSENNQFVHVIWHRFQLNVSQDTRRTSGKSLFLYFPVLFSVCIPSQNGVQQFQSICLMKFLKTLYCHY